MLLAGWRRGVPGVEPGPPCGGAGPGRGRAEGPARGRRAGARIPGGRAARAAVPDAVGRGRLRSALSARQPVEDEARASLRRLESVIAGSSTRGAAGENILERRCAISHPRCFSATCGSAARWSSSRFACRAASCCRWTRSGFRAVLWSSWRIRRSTRPGGRSWPARWSERSSGVCARSASTSTRPRRRRSPWQ